MCACGVGYVLKRCKLDGRGQNFSTHYPEVHNHSVRSNKKIMYGALQKHDCVSVPTYGLSRCTYYHVYVLDEFHCSTPKYDRHYYVHERSSLNVTIAKCHGTRH